MITDQIGLDSVLLDTASMKSRFFICFFVFFICFFYLSKKKKISPNLSGFKNDFSLNIVDYPEFLSTKRIKFFNYPPPPNPTPAFNLVICSLNADKSRCKSVCWWRKSQQFHQIYCAMQIRFSFVRGCFQAILCHFAGWKRRRVPSIVPEILKEVSIDHL